MDILKHFPSANPQKQPPGYSNKIVVLQNFRKMPVLESLFNKGVGLQTYKFIKKRLQHRGFPMKFTKFLRRPILKVICQRLLMNPPSVSSGCKPTVEVVLSKAQ